MWRLGKKRRHIAVPAVGIDRGQGPCRLNPEPAPTGEPNFGQACSGNNLVPVGVKGFGLIRRDSLNVHCRNGPAHPRGKIAAVIHATGRRNLAGILPPFRDQRGDGTRQIRGGAGCAAQDDTVARRRVADRGDPCLYIIRWRCLQLPGLGNAEGLIDPASSFMMAIAKQDADVADFAARAQDFWGTWFKELAENGDDIYARGCGWNK